MHKRYNRRSNLNSFSAEKFGAGNLHEFRYACCHHHLARHRGWRGSHVLGRRFANAVKTNELVIESNEQIQKSINTSQTRGFAIATKAEYEDQLEDARSLAAKRAAAIGRGANMGIGRLGTTDAKKNKKVASKGLDADPSRW